MKIQLLEAAASVLAAIIVMILHEIPKSLLFLWFRRREEKSLEEKRKWKWSSAFMFHRYIDPIGLLLCITTYGGFSKPYMFRIRDRKTNYILGMLGFLDLICIYMISEFILYSKYQVIKAKDLEIFYGNSWGYFGKLFWIYMAILSLGIFFINLFPVSIFDMGLIIAGRSPRVYLNIIQKDSIIKIIVLFTMAVGVNTNIALMLFSFLTELFGNLW